jgi:hypothetical protein
LLIADGPEEPKQRGKAERQRHRHEIDECRRPALFPAE